MAELPTNIDTGLVTGRFIVGVADGPDEGDEPDVIAAQGSVTFTASVPYLPSPTALPGPVTILKTSITCPLDSEGYVCTPDPADPTLPGARGVRLIATDDPDLLVQGWTWMVAYRFATVNGATPAIAAHSFALPAGKAVDLTTVVKVPSSTGVGLAQAEAAALRAEAAAQIALDIKAAADAGAFNGKPGLDGSNVLPTDTAIAQALSTEGSATQTAFRGRVRHYNTGDNTELVATIPVPLSATSADKRVIYSIEIPDLKVGDLLMASSEFQITNDLGYNVMLMTQIIIAETATSVAGWEVTESNGRNITPAAHHDTFPKFGTYQAVYTTRRFINVVAWCGATNAKPGHTVTVDADYGRLSVIRF